MNKILVDPHTHTLASGHAYSTLREMAERAGELGLQVLGITDHAPALPGAPLDIYFHNLHVVPRELYGVHLLMGVELNILDTKGTIDLDEYTLRRLDLRVAGLHKLCWQGGTIDENTAGMVSAIRNPWVQIISHPGDGTAPLHFEPIVLAAKETGTLLELNSSSLNPTRGKWMAHDNFCEILRLCKRYEVPISLGSDAHIAYAIADYRFALPLLSETDFPDALVVNDKPDYFFRCLKPTPLEMKNEVCE